MTPENFIARWRNSTRTEKSASQEHFLDLCELLDVPKPAAVDPHGTEYTFEKLAKRAGGENGYADVWKKNCFGWEYKGPKKNLVQAYTQLKQYADGLGNPPLLIVSDMQEIRIHTNFTNEISEQHVIKLADLNAPENLEKLRWCFTNPERLRPTVTREVVTAKAAVNFAQIAVALRKQHDPRRVAHFVNKLVFCLFAEDIELLPDRIFADILDEANKRPDDFAPMMGDLFRAMANRNGRFGAAAIPWFNGGLFDDEDVLPIGIAAEKDLIVAARLDWSVINPTIFGTLFESGLDDKKRAEMASLFDQPAPEARQARLFDRAAPNKGVGIHYTDPGTIMKIIEPVVMRPWRDEWDALKAKIRALNSKRDGAKSGKERTKAVEEARALYGTFRARLGKFRVLDPACGSGNFLALSLGTLKDFDLEVIKEAAQLELPPDSQRVGVEAVLGIEINPYAAELARLTVWITELQWQLRNGFHIKRAPILGKLDGIVCRDALVNRDGTEARWPDADVIIGNPPFLGSRFFIRELTEQYAERIREAYKGKVTGDADLVTYWVSRAVDLLEQGKITSFGLVATKSVAKGASRRPLDRLIQNKDLVIFDAWTNEPWVLKGAQVRVSIMCAGRKEALGSRSVVLNGTAVSRIASDLTPASLSGGHITDARRLKENLKIAFQGVKLTGSFDISGDVARKMLRAPANPNGRHNSEVVKRLWDIDDVTGRPSDRWVIDFGTKIAEADAALFQEPFEYLRARIPRERAKVRERRTKKQYWLFQRARGELRRAVAPLSKYIVTPETSEYRLFVWADCRIIIVGSLFAIARDDDTTFGILHSKFHDRWATRAGNRLGVGNQRRYNITSTFETFPFPEGLTPNIPAVVYETDPRAVAIAKAAKQLDELRRNWLNPPELIKIESELVAGYPDRIIPRGLAAEADLKKRTLTKLYNECPTWLANAHRDLDAAVAAAYGWPAEISEDDALARLLDLNRARATAEQPPAKAKPAPKAAPIKPVPSKAKKPKAERHPRT